MLRRVAPASHVNTLWRAARDGSATGPDCPLCHNQTTPVQSFHVPDAPGAIEVDVCTACHSVWFDPSEWETVPPAPVVAGPDDHLSPKAREILARAKVELIRERADREEAASGHPPECPVSTILTVFGFPAEENAPALTRWPIMTWLSVLMMVAATLYALYGPPGVIETWGLIPSDPFRTSGLTIITSFFLHASLMHLIGNGIFLLLFGDNVEDYLGHASFVFLLVGSSLCGDLCHALMDPRSEVPMVGASGGISGVLAFYALQFPQARLVLAFRWAVYFRWFRIPAWGAFLAWVVLESFGVFQQMAGFTNVSSLAHLGGAAFGFLVWMIHRASAERTAPDHARGVMPTD